MTPRQVSSNALSPSICRGLAPWRLRDLPEFGRYVHEIRETLLVSGALTERTVSNG